MRTVPGEVHPGVHRCQRRRREPSGDVPGGGVELAGDPSVPTASRVCPSGRKVPAASGTRSACRAAGRAVAEEPRRRGEHPEQRPAGGRRRPQPVGLHGEQCRQVAAGRPQRDALRDQLVDQRGAGGAGGLPALPDGDQPGDQGQHQTQRGGRQGDPLPAGAGPCRVLLGLGEGLGGVQEVGLGGGQGRCRPGPPVQRGGQPCAAVELAVRPVAGLPVLGRDGEVSQQPLAGGVLVQPGPQPRPGPGKGLVGQRGGRLVGGDQPAAGQQVQHPVPSRITGHRREGDAGRGGFAVRGQGDQPQQQGPDLGRAAAWLGLPHRLRRLGHRALDAAAGPVAVHGEHPGLAACPGLGQRVGQQRQGARLVLHLADQQLDQAGLEPQPGMPGRPVDRLAQLVTGHRGDQVQALLHQPGGRRGPGEPAELVGADHQHHPAPGLRQLHHLVQEPGHHRRGVGGAEQLLELVHHHHQVSARAGQGGGQRLRGLGAGRDQHHRPTRALHPGNHAGPHQRGLAAPGRPGHHQQRTVAQDPQAGHRLAIAAEEPVRIRPVVDQQTLIRTHTGVPHPTRGGRQVGVVVQDRAFQLDQLPARVQSELVLQGPARAAQRAQRVGLPPRPVQGHRQQVPAGLPQRLRGDQRRRVGDHVVTESGPLHQQRLLRRSRSSSNRPASA